MGYPKVYETTANHYFYVIKDAIDENSKEEFYLDTIRHQIIYTFPNIQLFQSDQSVVLGSYDMTTLQRKITGEEELSMPFDLVFPDIEAPPYFISPTTQYLKKVLGLKKIAKGQKIIKVSYQIQLKMEICQKNQNEILKTLKLPMPVEPWFTYFQIDPQLKIERSLPYLGSVKVNPCTTVPLFDSDRQETYWTMWYFWNPFQVSEGSESQFDCANYYKKDLHWHYADVSLKTLPIKSQTPELARLKELKKVKMSFMFNSHKVSTFKRMEGEEVKLIEMTYKKILSKLEFAQAKKLMDTNFAKHDNSLTAVGVFLFHLAHNSIIKGSRFEIHPYYYKIKLDGILKLSAKPFEMTLVLSTNKPEHGSYDPFNDEVARGLTEDDVVTISTHSSFGISLDSAVKKAREQATSPKRPKYQFVAMLSCLARSYFSPDSLGAPQKGKTIDYVYSLATFTESLGIGPLTMIGMVDHAMRFGQSPPFESWLKNNRHNNFISFEKVSGKP